eukprot:scaffold301307_cov29-Tisochrysis_lutea.AAC.4
MSPPIEMPSTPKTGAPKASITPSASDAISSTLYAPSGASDSPMPRLSKTTTGRRERAASTRGSAPQSPRPQAKPWTSSSGFVCTCAAFGVSTAHAIRRPPTATESWRRDIARRAEPRRLACLALDRSFAPSASSVVGFPAGTLKYSYRTKRYYEVCCDVRARSSRCPVPAKLVSRPSYVIFAGGE